MAIRNSYIVSKALNSYLKGSVIIAISARLITTTDAIIVSWLIGSKAFTAVNTVLPILTLISSIMIMLSTGEAISLSKALGMRDKSKVNLAFSASFVGSAIIGIIVAVLTYKFSAQIVNVLVHHDSTLYKYAIEYLKTFCFAIPFLILSGVTGHAVRTDGNTRLMSIAVWVGIILNIILDIVFVGFLGFGISGAAWATAINYFVVLIISLFHFVSKDNTIKWSNDIRHYFSQLFLDFKQGFSTSLADILLAVSLFVINSLMIHYEGNEGIYCWAVCYQIFLIMEMILSGIDTSIFAIGGVLLGEDDVKGLDYLYRRSAIYLLISICLLSAAIIIFPEFFGSIFGNKGEDKLDLLPSVLKIFSLFLLPYSIIMQVRSVYTILGRGILSLFLCIAAFSLMIFFNYLGCLRNFDTVWWAFPTSAWLLLIILFIYTSIIHFKNRQLRIFSLIPKSVADPAFFSSIASNADAVKQTEEEVAEFLKNNNIPESKISYINSIISVVMENILNYLLEIPKKKRFFDINVRIKSGDIVVILKDDGHRLDEEKEEAFFSLPSNSSVTPTSSANTPVSLPSYSTNYFYMNEQNTFTLNFT